VVSSSAVDCGCSGVAAARARAGNCEGNRRDKHQRDQGRVMGAPYIGLFFVVMDLSEKMWRKAAPTGFIQVPPSALE